MAFVSAFSTMLRASAVSRSSLTSATVRVARVQRRAMCLDMSIDSAEDRRYGQRSFADRRLSCYIGNISWGSTEDDLRELCTQCGEVTSVRIVTDRETGRSRGFGFVSYADEDSVDQACEALNGAVLGGRPLRVNRANDRPERSDRPPRRNSGGYSDDGGF